MRCDFAGKPRILQGKMGLTHSRFHPDPEIPAMSFVANRLDAIKPSPTLAVTAKAARLKAEGKDVISMGAGEPDFDTPQFIKEAAIAAIHKGHTKVHRRRRHPSLKKAIVAKFKRDNGLDYTEKQILASVGGKQTSFNLCMALLNPGDEAIIPAPYWVSYPDMAMMADAKPVFVPAGIDQGFKMTAAQLERAITPKSRLLWINSPPIRPARCIPPRSCARWARCCASTLAS
jgi:aspartate aminotransferase